MPQPKTGYRVGAILRADAAEVRLLGYGTYQGDLPSPLGFPNPCIKLDSGGEVWGYECWWGDEEGIKNAIGNRKVVLVDTDDNPVN